MNRTIGITAMIVGLLISAISAHGLDAPDVEIFGGYQFFHANSGVSFSGFNSFNMNGWNGA